MSCAYCGAPDHPRPCEPEWIPRPIVAPGTVCDMSGWVRGKIRQGVSKVRRRVGYANDEGRDTLPGRSFLWPYRNVHWNRRAPC